METTKQNSGSLAKSLSYRVVISNPEKDNASVFESCKNWRKTASDEEVDKVAVDVNVTEADEDMQSTRQSMSSLFGSIAATE